MKRDLPTPEHAKSEAKRLREELAESGIEIGHGQALERVARRYGQRDWNTLAAAMHQRLPRRWKTGEQVTGRYLSQPFAATIRSADTSRPGWSRLVLDLAKPIDVVRFESFSNVRRRIRVDVGPDGRSLERTSDGTPHVELEV